MTASQYWILIDCSYFVFIASWSYQASELVYSVRSGMTMYIPHTHSGKVRLVSQMSGQKAATFWALSPSVNSKSKESQVNALVYTMGDKAEDILLSFRLSEEDQ